MDVGSYIIDKALILIPVLYILGMLFKNTYFIKDWAIPWLLIFLGIMFSIIIIGFNAEGIVQGILVAGTTVLGNQLVKQTSSKDLKGR